MTTFWFYSTVMWHDIIRCLAIYLFHVFTSSEFFPVNAHIFLDLCTTSPHSISFIQVHIQLQEAYM